MKARAITIPLTAFAIVVGLVGNAVAHPAHDHAVEHSSDVRTWTDRSGEFHFHGAFVAATNETVRIQNEQGRLLSLDFSQLSPADQQWVREHATTSGIVPTLMIVSIGALVALTVGLIVRKRIAKSSSEFASESSQIWSRPVKPSLNANQSLNS